ncbi:uncharacterized protein AKAME5_001980100 [Lates japonicus]|uniref:Uncharacterized protein n=1 Tax=Lates japonicus TaxID=270547 RepID=A0AAD3N8D8_LATJO|nr:uncharacterized protein AKAME5_001980100 [Lates japonicus]
MKTDCHHKYGVSFRATILTGLTLVCGGRKPSNYCVRLNVCLHIATVLFSAVAFGAMVRHVPYPQRRHCGDSCPYFNHDTMVLISGILAILITIFLVGTLISLAVVLTGLCSMCSDFPQQTEDPEHIGGSTTSEPLCLPSQEQVTAGGEDVKTDS